MNTNTSAPVSNAKKDRYKYGTVLIAALVGAGLVEAKLFPGVFTVLIIGFLAVACAFETSRMVRTNDDDGFPKASLTLAILVVLSHAIPRLESSLTAGTHLMVFRRLHTAELGFAAFLVFAIACVLRQKPQGAARNLGAGTLVILVATSLLYLIDLRFFNGEAGFDGLQLLLFVVGVSKIGDIAAYIVGSAIGRNKLIPAISPGKTWEGAIASLIASIGLAAVFAIFHFAGPLSIKLAIWAGLFINVASQFGDLVESLLKRSAGLKDSGSWLPQFGGAFDLADSLFLAGPVFYGYLRFIAY